MNFLSHDDGSLHALNVFTVRPENQQAVIDAIRAAGHVEDVPGLRSIHLLRSHDGTRVINHMHWESPEAFEAATAGNAVIAATRRAVMDLVEGARPDRYDVIDLTG
jgi:heme-degrading monooxygenase HmoA